ncbi:MULTISPECIES: SH3 domain-containing protein [unclassified Beijerinckia]|uniref:SH3 domain-containing protein n=1 Tax=unclassified Beijerinckia TaxID=2638183 RepID=UPI000899FD18|nr:MULTISPECIES: SH3 domain-containing protein [unclassified Beijerinckia]MDH7797882.1 hypothetical protein [Beijerinckia sp. GAS462]SED01635.1 SH3 domain-containing protein [Beijerinckia sp. 28-YEA-48]
MRKTALLVAAGLSAVLATEALAAGDRCKVTDPTGTPLNVRTAPQGKVVGKLPNGAQVQMTATDSDAGGRTWAFISRMDGRPVGWVYREFVSCY